MGYPSPAVPSFGHPEAVAKDMTTFLVVVLVVLVGSAIFGFWGLLELRTDSLAHLCFRLPACPHDEATDLFAPTFLRSQRPATSIKWQ